MRVKPRIENREAGRKSYGYVRLVFSRHLPDDPQVFYRNWAVAYLEGRTEIYQPGVKRYLQAGETLTKIAKNENSAIHSS